MFLAVLWYARTIPRSDLALPMILVAVVGSMLLITSPVGNVWLARRLRRAGGEICLNRRYPLASLAKAGDCPECGQPFQIDEVVAAWKRWSVWRS